ncbi:unnamed protein product, partial [Vitis vinifera]
MKLLSFIKKIIIIINIKNFSGESTAAPVSFWTRSRKVVASAWTKVVEVGGGVGGEETV